MPPTRSRGGLTQAEQFGFDTSQRHRALHQLQELLKLDDDRFKKLKQRLKKITEKRLDIDMVGRIQNKALDKAVEDLKSQLPIMFDRDNVEQREYFVRRVILIIHGQRRKNPRRTSHMKENKKPSVKDEDDGERLDLGNGSKKKKKPIPRPLSSAKPALSLAERMAANLLSITNGTQAPKIFASPMPAPRNVKSSPSHRPATTRFPLLDVPASTPASGSLARQQHSPILSPKTPKPNVVASTLTSTSKRTLNAHGPTPSLARGRFSGNCGSREIKAEGKSSFPPTSSTNMVAGSSTSLQGSGATVPTPRRGQIRSVHKFLEAVTPPMTHLLHRFVDFGCLGEDFLFAVSTWSPDRIRTFLKSLPPGPGGNAPTGMEVEILVYHFESYFLISKSTA